MESFPLFTKAEFEERVEDLRKRVSSSFRGRRLGESAAQYAWSKALFEDHTGTLLSVGEDMLRRWPEGRE